MFTKGDGEIVGPWPLVATLLFIAGMGAFGLFAFYSMRSQGLFGMSPGQTRDAAIGAWLASGIVGAVVMVSSRRARGKP